MQRLYVFFSLCARRRDTNHRRTRKEEPDTDVGAPIDCPGDVAVLQPNGSTYRPAANDSEAAELLEAAGVRPLGVVLNTVEEDSSTGANAAALKRVRPFLEVVTVPKVASWHEAVPAMKPVIEWLDL